MRDRMSYEILRRYANLDRRQQYEEVLESPLSPRITSSAYGSPPSDPREGDLWISDYYAQYYNGSGWIPLWHAEPMALPPQAGWSWVNQGTASLFPSYGDIHLQVPLNAGAGHRMYVRTAPATPYDLYIKLETHLVGMAGGADQHAGVVFRESGSGKFVFFGLYANSAGNAYQLYLTHYSSVTVVSSVKIQVPAPIPWFNWIEIRDDGADRVYHMSHNGYDLYEFYRETRTTFLTADQIGISVNNASTTHDAAAKIYSWG